MSQELNKTETAGEIAGDLVKFLNQRLQPPTPIDAQTDLLGEGYLDSLLIVELMGRIEKVHGAALSNADIAPRHFRTAEKLGQLAAERKTVGPR